MTPSRYQKRKWTLDAIKRVKNMKDGDAVIIIHKDRPGDIHSYEKGKMTFWWLRDWSVKHWRQWLRKSDGELNKE